MIKLGHITKLAIPKLIKKLPEGIKLNEENLEILLISNIVLVLLFFVFIFIDINSQRFYIKTDIFGLKLKIAL